MFHGISEIDRFKQRKVLVTGASGFIGSYLVERLAVEGAQVAGLSRSRGHLDAIDAAGVEFFQCDLADAETVRLCVGGFKPDAVFHFASHPDAAESYDQSASVIQINLIGTLNLLDALKDCGCASLVYGDTCKVYGSEPPPYSSLTRIAPNSSYAVAKSAGWQLCQLYRSLYGLKAVSVRPTIVYGPRQPHNVFSAVLQKLAAGDHCIPIDGGTQTRDPLFITDLVELCLMAEQNIDQLDGMALNCGGGAEISVTDLISLLVKKTGMEVEVKPCPERMRKTELLRCFCDNVEVGQHLGWAPKVSLQEGIERLLHVWLGTDAKPQEPVSIL